MKFKNKLFTFVLKFILFFYVYRSYSLDYDTVLNKFVNSNGKIFFAHGFIGVKTLEIFKNIIKISCKKNRDDKENMKMALYISGFLWNLAKFKIKFQVPYEKFDLTFGINSFFYDYDNYFISTGCMYLYPGPECIFRRIGFGGIHIGYEGYYTDNINKNHVFSYNISGIVNVIAKKYIPFDLIVSFSPIIYQNHYKFYIELNTNFSIGEFIKKILIANVHYSKLYRNNWDIDSLPESIDGDKKIMEHFIDKNTKLLNGQNSKAKFILVDGLIWSLLYNTRLYIGIKIL